MKICISLLFSLLCAGIHAQSTSLTEIYATSPVEATMPFNVDTADRNDKKFAEERLLKLPVSIPEQSDFVKVYQADTAGFFHLEASGKKPFVQLFSFYVHAGHYGKAKITAVSSSRLEILVNDKTVSSKAITGDSISAAQETTAEFSP
jgi:hypothetical protein